MNDDEALSLELLVQQIASNKHTKIVVVLGAGVSVSAGIPDFRTPGTGLYSKLEEYNLPYPEAIFELGYFRMNPQPFVEIAKAIWPGQEDGPKPTLAHAFLALLEQRGLLRRVYTQNIDGLERLAGVSDDKLIECHGHFSTCSCINAGCPNYKPNKIDPRQCQEAYSTGTAMQCPNCNSLVKPDIVFFGEELPSIFVDTIYQDMDDCDLLIVMGTSLLVAPVASIPNWVGRTVPRLLINRDIVGAFLKRSDKRNVIAQGDCDEGVRKICKLAGKDWIEQLEEIHGSC